MTDEPYIIYEDNDTSNYEIELVEKEYFSELDCYGIIKGLYLISTHGRIYNKKRKRYLKGYKRNEGYIEYKLKIDNGGKDDFLAHRLVLETFGPYKDKVREDRVFVNHRFGKKHDNYVDRLEWCTQAENNKHAIDTGLKNFEHMRGVNHYNAVFTEDEVHTICKMLEDGHVNYTEVCNAIGREYSTELMKVLHHIKSGKTWRHISSQYNIDSSDKSRKYSDDTIHEICSYLELGMKTKNIVNIIIDKLGMLNSDREKIRKILTHIKNNDRYIEISKGYNIKRNGE